MGEWESGEWENGRVENGRVENGEWRMGECVNERMRVGVRVIVGVRG